VSLEHVVAGVALYPAKRILVLTPDPATRASFAAAIARAGHRALALSSAAAVPHLLAETVVDLALIDTHDDEGVVLGHALWLDHGVPFVIVVDAGEDELVRRAIAAGAVQCLARPLVAGQLELSIGVALVQAREFARLSRSVQRLSQHADHDTLVARAVGMTMERYAVDDTEAFEMLLVASRARSETLAEFCTRLLANQGQLGLKRTLGARTKQSG